MKTNVIEFKTILAVSKDPYLRNNLYFAKFGSKEAIDHFNELNKTFFRWDVNWEICFGRRIDGNLMPEKLIDSLHPITTRSINQLKERWTNSKDNKELPSDRYAIIDGFIKLHTTSKLNIL